ncbi:general secretion pathway protein GspK [Pseudomonas sp. SDI]|uniref:general secretion pathway protein GspK n=1 Tax=Pseudomonas sp. SDI TaxID=2170734 RepID=UPI0014040A47|nr:general secretion pathway protein GspK [Pseudomonas sp. SDI]
MALITVLLVLALVLVSVSALLRSHQLALDSLGQQLRAMQLRQLAEAAERHALGRLRRRETLTHAGQAWAQPQLLELAPARVRIAIEDLAGRFNLRTLARQGQLDQPTLRRWQNLRKALAIDALAPEQWQGLRLLSLDQLRVLPGVDRALLKRLQPRVALLPVTQGLNVNTVGAPLLAMLEGIDEAAARQLLQQRPEHGFPSVQAFTAQAQAQQLLLSGQGLAVASNWFRLTIEVQLGEQRLYLYSEVQREEGSPTLRVVRRTLSPFEEHHLL